MLDVGFEPTSANTADNSELNEIYNIYHSLESAPLDRSGNLAR